MSVNPAYPGLMISHALSTWVTGWARVRVVLRPILNGALTTTLDHISLKVSQKTDVALEMRSDFPSVNANSSVKIGQANSSRNTI